jgi:hypothetical protein
MQVHAVFHKGDVSMKQDPDRKLETRSGSRAMKGPAGWHPVGIAAGAAAGAVAGAAIGTAVAGPVGALAGCAICAAIGALFGQTAAETVRPTVEELYSMRSSSSAIVSGEYGRPSEAHAIAPSAADASMRVRPPVGRGSPLAVSGLRFPARSRHKKEIR